MRVIVVGAGVIGLSCAALLAEAGHAVEVRCERAPLDTTSAVAAALWYPYRAHPRERVTAWGAHTYAALADLAARTPESGVRMRAGTELLRAPADLPWWAGAVPDLRALDQTPPGYAGGWFFTAPVIEMGRYLPWLQHRLEQAGGVVVQRHLHHLPRDADVVVHASGLAGRELAGDRSVQPVRGQVLVLAQVGLDRWCLDETGPTYVVPRERDIVVGGSDEEGSNDEVVDDAQAEAIRQRAIALVPELAAATVLGHRVGLRPARPTVRLETEQRPDGPPVVHCYGHGGAGITLSWGCAAEVLELVQGGQNSRIVGSSKPRNTS